MPSRWKVFNNKKAEKKYNIPQELHFPFRICIVGGTGSGKTNLVLNLIYEEYAKVLKRVILMAGKPDTISEMKELHEEKKSPFDLELYKKYNDDKVHEIMEELEANHTESCFIFEDLTTFNVSKKQKKNGIDRIVMNGRQSGASMIISSQSYMDINHSTRSTNCSMLILYANDSDTDKENVYKNHASGLSKEQFIKLWDDYSQDKFSFLVIDKTQPQNSRFRDSDLKVIDITPYKNDGKEEEDNDGEVISGKKQPKEKPKAKPQSQTSQPTNSKIKLKRIDKGDSLKMKATFDVNGKEQTIPFGKKERNYVEEPKNRALRFDFLQNFTKSKSKNPLDSDVLEKYLLFETNDLKNNLKDFRDKFNV